MVKKDENSNGKTVLIKRLKKVEGQIRGLQKMIIDNRQCKDIFSQFSAINGAMRQVAYHLMQHYMKQCLEKTDSELPEDIKNNLQQYLKTISR